MPTDFQISLTFAHHQLHTCTTSQHPLITFLGSSFQALFLVCIYKSLAFSLSFHPIPNLTEKFPLDFSPILEGAIAALMFSNFYFYFKFNLHT